MNNKVKSALNISQKWVNENEDIYQSLILDFLNPVTEVVEKLLNETDIKVAVYNGQLDLIVNTPGKSTYFIRVSEKVSQKGILFKSNECKIIKL